MSKLLPSSDPRAYRAGFAATAGAFFIWGLFPLFLKPLNHVPAVALTATRVVMACVFAFAVLALRGELPLVRAALGAKQTRRRLLLTSALINVNWVLYAWGVANGHVIDTSLGYFINPLVNVLLGVAILSERLNAKQWIAVALAAAGVAYLTWVSGEIPWLAVGLALTFSVYGLIRKITPVSALPGLASEMLLFSPVAISVLIYSQLFAGAAFEHGWRVDTFLALSGPMTAIPLTLFAFGAQRIPYATVGMLQYIGPSLQLMLGVVMYHEPFTASRLAGFCLIWLALLLYVGDGLWRSRTNAALLQAD